MCSMKTSKTIKSAIVLFLLFISISLVAQSSSCSAGFSSVSNNLTVNFTNTSSSNTNSWCWDFGDGSTSYAQHPSHTYSAVGTYNVAMLAYDSINNCLDSIIKPVTVINTTSCIADYTYTTNGLQVDFTSTSSPNVSLWHWDFGDGTTNNGSSANVSHTFANAGTYSVKLKVFTGVYVYGQFFVKCVDNITKTITVSGTPSVSCNASFSQSLTGLQASFNSTDTNTTGSIYTFHTWDFGDGDSSSTQNPIYTYTAAGTYTVCHTIIKYNVLTNKWLCSDTYCDTITIAPVGTCNVDFTYTISGLTAMFSDASTPSMTIKNWSSGEGNPYKIINNSSSQSHTYSAPGNYMVKYKSWDVYPNATCSDSIVKPIKVGNPTCTVDFSYSANGFTVSFTDQSSNNMNEWFWHFNDGHSINDKSYTQNSTYTYQYPGTYNIYLYAKDSIGNCAGSTFKTIIIGNNPTSCSANFSSSSVNLTTNFTNLSSSNTNWWKWHFGDGSISYAQNPTHTYLSAGTYPVLLESYDSLSNCVDSLTKLITVSSSVSCNADFTYSISGNTVTFNNLSSASSATAYYWYFGDGSASYQISPTHTYSNAGVYTTRLYILDSLSNCTDSIVKQISTNGVPCVANFNYSASALAVNFLNTSSSNTNLWMWYFGDGSTSSAQNPNHTYSSAGTYTVILRSTSTTDNCVDSVSKQIVVNSQCNADYSYIANGLTASFTNLSSPDMTDWTWYFGDGDSSTAKNPIHIYNSPGMYWVGLWARKIDSTGAYKCGNLYYDSIFVGGSSLCKADFNYITSGLNVSFTNTSSSNTNSWIWHFGDGTSSNAQSPNYTYTSAGTYNVQLISSDSSCSDSITKTITVISQPVLCTANYSYAKSGLTVNFTDLSTGVNSRFWYFGDGAFSSALNPSHTYASAGTYTAVLIAYDNSGSCSDTISKVITVNPAVCIADYNYNISSLTVSFTDISSSNINARDWDFGDGTFSTSLTNPSHTYLSGGTYNVRMIAYDTINGCSDTIIKPINVYDPSQCNAIFFALGGTTSSTVGTPITFFNASIGSSNASWSFGDGFSSNAYSPIHIYNSPGWYNVCLTINDSNCIDVTCDSIYVDSSFTIQAAFSYVQQGNNQVSFTNGSTQRANMTYYWDFGDGSTSTEMSPTHQYTSGGNYKVCLIATDRATNISSMYCENFVDPSATIGVREYAEKEINVYPNPVSNLLTIDAEGVSKVRVLNATGLLVLNTDATKIDMTDYSSGIYLVQIVFKDGSVANKRVVKTQ